MLKPAFVAAVLILIVGLGADVRAEDTAPVGDAKAGRLYAVRVCADCHDVLSHEDGDLSKGTAPHFYAIANDKTTSGIGLNVFLTSPHAPMPNFIIGEPDRLNLIAYILSLRDRK